MDDCGAYQTTREDHNQRFGIGNCESIVEYVCRGVGIGFVHDICLPKRAEKEIRSRDMRDKVGTVEVAIIYKYSIARQASYQALIDACKSRESNSIALESHSRNRSSSSNEDSAPP